jgi:hypothetical protein
MKVLMSHEFNDIKSTAEAEEIFSEALEYLWAAPYAGIDEDFSLIVAFRLALSVVAFFGQHQEVAPPVKIWIWMEKWQIPLNQCIHEIEDANLRTAFHI